MDVRTYIAETAPEAVAKIREELGPEAVILHVRQFRPEGVARLWRKPRIEILACKPEQPSTVHEETITALLQEISELRQTAENRIESDAQSFMADASQKPGVGALLERMGLLPLNAQRVVEEIAQLRGESAPESLTEELESAKLVLAEFWRNSVPAAPLPEKLHVFIGPSGAGKTTCLCKWLAQAVLLEGKSAWVWRLDGQTANTAESLSVYGEILGVPVDRCWDAERTGPEVDVAMIDLPGVNWRDTGMLAELAQSLRRFPAAQVHLVLNAAYETSSLMNQWRAFASLPVTDLIFTHLDEQPRWGKLWNFVIGTNCRVGFLSAGQNIPGEFHRATPDRLLEAIFARK